MKPVDTGRPMRQLLQQFRRHLILHLLATGVASLVVFLPVAGTFAWMLKVVAAAALAVILNGVLLLWRARDGVAQLVQFVAHATDRESPVIVDYLLSRLCSDLRIHAKQMTEKWVELDADGLEAFVEVCFRKCRGKYIGTDRHVPSEFRKLYPTYLDSETTRRATNGDVRILIVDFEHLKHDEQAHAEDVRLLFQKHQQDGVRLLQTSFVNARDAATRQSLASADVGVFGNDFVVFFLPPVKNSGKKVVRVRLCPITDDCRPKVRAYVHDLLRIAKRLATSPQGKLEAQNRSQEVVDKDLSEFAL